ncbi:MAG: hypothetical protein U0V72_15730 [Cytophagales bacterium]
MIHNYRTKNTFAGVKIDFKFVFKATLKSIWQQHIRKAKFGQKTIEF